MNILNLFDFDGTLFRSPLDTPENRRLFEEHTGIPWRIDKALARQLSAKHGRHIGMRSGWHGRAETLEPPLTPDPAPEDWFIKPTVAAFLESKKAPKTKTVLATGRHAGIQSHVLRVLEQGRLVKIETKKAQDNKVFRTNIDPDVEILFCGMDGPAPAAVGRKPSETIAWKCWILDQFYLTLEDLQEINIWEDREEHGQAFQEWSKSVNIPVNVNLVRD